MRGFVVYDAPMRMHWERFDLGGMLVPLIIVASLVCLVVGAFQFSTPLGWAAAGLAGLILARGLDRDDADTAAPTSPAALTEQVYGTANGARR